MENVNQNNIRMMHRVVNEYLSNTRKYPFPEVNENQFKLGDIVSRDGSDEHLIYAPVDDWGNIDIVCIKEPKIYEGSTEPWIKIGEVESNLKRRYSFLRHSLNHEIILENIGRTDLIKKGLNNEITL
jgi:hypothetical protein